MTSKMNLPGHLEDKIFEIKCGSDDVVSKIISYFPLSEPERREILSILNRETFGGFHSIFADHVTEEEWARTREQIKKKFCGELFDIDAM